MPDFDRIKSQQQAMWADGDFALIGWNTVFAGELLCEAADLRAGQSVLDIACGSGNAALSAARRFTEATGIDYVPALIDRARERAAAERVPASFDVGDAEALPYDDASFDVTLSVFGIMFAPNQERAAAEMIRVTRPGGTIALANWTPDGMWGELFKLHGRYLPPPEGVRPPPLWGTGARIQELLGEHVGDLRMERRIALFRQRSPRHWFDFFSRHFGLTRKVLATLDDAGREGFASEVEEILRRFNRSVGEDLVAEAEYLEVRARKR
jgi:SAM-dependent methyltransferase